MNIKKLILLGMLLGSIIAIPNVAFAENKYITLDLTLDYKTYTHKQEEVFVAIDGKKLNNLTMPPIILNSYTLVPAREVFEGLGAEVTWNAEVEQVHIATDDNNLLIPIDSSKAYVNGKTVDMQTEAKIINNKTMIPLRFVSTSLGFEIDWDNNSRIANIATNFNHDKDNTNEQNEIKEDIVSNLTGNIGYDKDKNTLYIKNINNSIDINSIVHYDNYSDLKYNLTIPVNYTEHIKTSSINIDSDKVSTCNITANASNINISFIEKKIIAVIVSEENGYILIKPVLPKEKYDKIIVLDAGHGGDDPGAIGNSLREKDLTLAMLLSANKLFEEDGTIKCYVTRNDDTYLSLSQRAAFANELGDAFISIHINAATNPAAKGTETYSLYPNDQGNGLISYTLAEEILNQLLGKLGTINRGVKTANWTVIKESKIPATLIEIGFISNPDEAAMMAKNIDEVGESIYKGIVNLFEKYPPVRKN